MNNVHQTPFGAIVIGLVAIGLGPSARADTISLEPSKDNTLIENAAGALSNGAGDSVCCGRVAAQGNFTLRRALLAFDVAAGVPAGSTINSVELTMSLANTNNSTSQTCRLRRVLADWGEGTSLWFGCAGNTASAADATWIHREFSGALWATPGGDLSPATSASTAVGPSLGPYTWGSTATLTADVQGWLDAPATNFGWVVIGNETTPGSGMKFSSREWPAASARPALTIDFTPPPCAGDADESGTVDIDDIILIVLNFGNTGAPGIPGDVDGSGVVDIDDVILTVLNFGPC